MSSKSTHTHKHTHTHIHTHTHTHKEHQVGVRAWPHAVISSLGVRARGGGGQAPAFRVARCRTRSLVDIRLGPAGSRQGWSGTHMGPYLSRTPIRVHRVIRQGSSGPVGNIGQSSVRSKNIKYGPKWVENRPFAPKQRPNEPNRLSGPIRTTPEAKNGQKSDFLRKTAPGGRPAAPSDPVS